MHAPASCAFIYTVAEGAQMPSDARYNKEVETGATIEGRTFLLNFSLNDGAP